MKPTVYIDTTIPSYYVDTRVSLGVHIERTRAWWDEEWDLYEVFTSAFVLRELEEGDFPNKSQALELTQRVPLLAPDPEIEDIVRRYIENYLMPASDERDGFHLAFASFYKMDYLLTWNCAHLANVNKRQHIARINHRLGLFTPTILTPLELLPPERGD
jgi:predicted nucleic acid-binding protein